MPTTSDPCLQQSVQEGVLVLTITEAELHDDRLLDALRLCLEEAEPGDLVLDCRHVRSLSSAGLRPLLALRRLLRGKGGRVALCNLSPFVADVLRVTWLISNGSSATGLFEVYPDVGMAVAALTPAKHPAGPVA